MFKTKLAVLLLLICPTACLAQRVEPPAKKTSYITIFTHTNWESIPQEKKLVEQINSDVFKALRETSHFNHYKLDDPLVVSGRWGEIKESDLPIISLQLDSGGVVYHASKDKIPGSASAIYQEMKASHDIHTKLKTQEQVTVYENDSIEGLLDRLRPNKDKDEEAGGWIFNRKDTPLRDSLYYGLWLVGLLVFAMGLFLALCLAAPFSVLITLAILAAFRSKK